MLETLYCFVDEDGRYFSGMAPDKERPIGFGVDVTRDIEGARFVSEENVGWGATEAGARMLEAIGFKKVKVTLEVTELDGTPYNQPETEKITFKDILKDFIENGDI